jgi:hypothetical protein
VSDAIRPPTDPERPVTAADLAAVRAEVDALRAEVRGEVRTGRIVVVDDAGFERIRMTADGQHGHLAITARRDADDHPTRVDVFAIDAEDDAGPYVGVELVDGGDSVAGFTVIEGRPPRWWNRTT